MRYVDQSLAGVFETLYLLDTFAPEFLIADRKYLVEKQDIRIHSHRDGERQPQHHPARIGPQRLIDEIGNARELQDGIEFLVSSLARQSQQRRIQNQILRTGEIRM